MDKTRSYYVFEMFYWCGIRSGELLALIPAGFDFEKQTVTLARYSIALKAGISLQVLKRQRVTGIVKNLSTAGEYLGRFVVCISRKISQS